MKIIVCEEGLKTTLIGRFFIRSYIITFSRDASKEAYQ